eukprot:351955-Chlamydomonas_euryale.AAC.16
MTIVRRGDAPCLREAGVTFDAAWSRNPLNGRLTVDNNSTGSALFLHPDPRHRHPAENNNAICHSHIVHPAC